MANTTNVPKAKLGIRARTDAIQELVKRHQDEFDQMHEENRVRLGLSRRATSESPDEIRAKLERARARAEKYEELLAQVEADQRLASRR